jgi:hypothetical protein
MPDPRYRKGTTMDADLKLAEFAIANRTLLLDALDSHLYWQVNEDHSRRNSGEILEPMTAEEREVADAETELSGLIRAAEEARR